MVSAAEALPHDVSVDFAATGVVRRALLHPTDEHVWRRRGGGGVGRALGHALEVLEQPHGRQRSRGTTRTMGPSPEEHHHRSRGRLLLHLHDRRGRRRRCDGEADVLSATTRSRGTRTTAPNHPRSAPLRRWLTAPLTPLGAWRSGAPPGKTLRGVYEGRARRPSPLGSGEPPGRPKHPLRAQACQRLC